MERPDPFARLDRESWLRVGAIAIEGSLTRSALQRLGAPMGAAPAPDADVDGWLSDWIAQGLLRELAPTAGMTFAVGLGREQRFALHPANEQRVLRRLARQGDLDRVLEQTQRVLGERSLGGLHRAIQRGDLRDFDARFDRRAKLVPIPRAEWLRTSVCSAFDPDWLNEVFASEAGVVVERVLSEALPELADCGPLYGWAATAALPGTERTLAEHAILRADPDRAVEHASALPPKDALLVRVAAAFVAGDLPAANDFIDHALGPSRMGRAGLLAPIIAILLLERDDPRARVAARRLGGKTSRPTERGMARALRTLLRHLDGTFSGGEGKPTKRLDVYQLPPAADGWEVVLTALTVHLHSDRETTRASWATHLTRRATQWAQSGYGWLAKQSLLLARELEPIYCAEELRRLGSGPEALHIGPRELRLWDRIAPKPEWKIALDALADVTKTIVRSAHVTYRVAWFVDMASAKLSRPALQRYDPDAGGWTAGRRVSLSEIAAVEDRLALEDRDVLRSLNRDEENAASDPAEAYEALIGHPRVYGGARGSERIDVVRGHCRVETHDEPGGIRVVVHPAGAPVGVHVEVDGTRRITVYRVDAAFHHVSRLLPHGVRVPKAEEPSLLAVLGKLASGVDVRSPHLGAERDVRADSKPCVRMALQGGAFLVQVGVRPFGEEGRFFAAAGGPRSLHAVVGGARLRCERNFAGERERVARLVAACPTLAGGEGRTEGEPEEGGWSLGEESALVLLSELQACGLEHALEWRSGPGLRLVGSIHRKSIRGRLRCIKGWYVAGGSVRLDAQTEASLAELCRAPTLGRGRFVRIAPGEYAEVEAALIQTLAALRMTASGQGADLRIHPSAVSTLEELSSLSETVETEEATREWLRRVHSVRGARFELPDALRAELRPYQHEGYRWLRTLCELELGACLADDMGLGKTVQIIAALAAYADGGPILVVAPTSVCTNWALEIERFAPGLHVIDYAGARRAESLRHTPRGSLRGVWICSYALLQQDADRLAAVEWEAVVLDEAQLIKNPASLRARAAYRLTAKRRIAATGTPVENNLGDLWAIFRFLNPGLLGEWPSFRRRFVLPVERDGSNEVSAALRRLMAGYVLRRLKSDVLSELPPVTQIVHDIELAEPESTLYGILQRRIREKLFTPHGRRDNKLEVLAEITRLRRFCCHPKLVFPDAEVDSSKIEALLGIVEELRANDHRALVFSQFVDFLAMVRERLHERRVTYEYLDGSTPRRERQARVEAFQGGSASLFLISLKAGGFGLNLTGADYVIHLDPWWNPAVEAQATDRAHRIGQQRPVTVYRLVTGGTIEAKIVELQGRKHELARAVLDGNDLPAKVTTDDLLDLIAPAREGRLTSRSRRDGASP